MARRLINENNVSSIDFRYILFSDKLILHNLLSGARASASLVFEICIICYGNFVNFTGDENFAFQFRVIFGPEIVTGKITSIRLDKLSFRLLR